MSRLKKKLSFNFFLSALNAIYRNYFKTRRSKFGYIDRTARVRFPILIKGIENVYLYENSLVLGNSLIIATRAKFIMKRNSTAAEGLTVVCGNHPFVKGELFLTRAGDNDIQNAKDVIIEEDVGLGTNVTILNGVIIGRGAIIGSGSVVRNSVPPYSVIAGNPAKVIGFRFSPKATIEHEMDLYAEHERLSLELLQANYQKYFISRIKEIKSYLT